MGSLHVCVELPETRGRAYVFDTFPVRIGRGTDNQLVLDDPSVPRALCVAWLEGDGRTVRVEERPGLKNPLLCGRTRVEGGISGMTLCLRVGAVRMTLSSAPVSSRISRGKRPWALLLLFGLSGAVLLLTKLRGASGDRERAVGLFEMLPKSPICAPSGVTCVGGPECDARARLLRERGREVLSRPGSSLSERVDAVAMLQDAARMTAEAGAGQRDAAQREAKGAASGLTVAYQQEIVRLRTALKSGSQKEIRASAAALKAAVGRCDESIEERLEKIVAANREEVEVQ